MQKLAKIGVAFGLLLVTASPLQAADHSTKSHLRYARTDHRVVPTAAVVTIAENTPKFCYYLGGPHGTSWVCRQSASVGVAESTAKSCYYLGGPHGTSRVCRQ
jgi:hypothetical protein